MTSTGPSPDPEVCEALIETLGFQAKAVGDAIMEYHPELGESLLEFAHALRPRPATHHVRKPHLTLLPTTADRPA